MKDCSNHPCRRFQRDAILNGLISVACLSIMTGFVKPALANDTTAVLGTGGLQFTKTDELKMEREDLYLSTKEVRVKYIFRNLTDHEITTTVAFPMPVFPMETSYVSSVAQPYFDREGDIYDFHARADGQTTAASLEAHAFDKSGKDITEFLHDFGMSITDLHESFSLIGTFNNLKAEDQQKLRSLGIFDGIPHWTVSASYHWQQIFPAHAAITIEHWYKPSVGGGLVNVEGSINYWGYKESDPWCPDTTFRKAMHKLAGDLDYMSGRWIEYTLKTGANWAGPIGHFRLELDKGEAPLLSTCQIPGLSLKKQGNSFVAETDNFTPTTDLKILFLSPEKLPK